MRKKILVTGISGFAGSYLAEYLLWKDFEVYGTYLSENSLKNIAAIQDKLALTQINLTDEEKVLGMIQRIKPEFIVHLAALAAPGESFVNPNSVISNNISAQIFLLEAVRKSEINPKILIVSSADVYGAVRKVDLPIDEETPFSPTNPYAVSKLTQDFLGLQYFHSYNLSIIRVRPFNHIGPRQSPHFAVPTFAKKIAEIEKGNMEPILRVGNIETKRDFTDVRDIARAYVLALEKAKIGDVYNIGSGISYKISDIVDKLISFSKVKIRVEVDPKLLRPSDTPELICNAWKFRSDTGWKSEISIEQSLKETVDYWRNIV